MIVDKSIINVCIDTLNAKLAALKVCTDMEQVKAIMCSAPFDEDTFVRMQRIYNKKIQHVYIKENNLDFIQIIFRDSTDGEDISPRKYNIMHTCNMDIIYDISEQRVVTHWYEEMSLDAQYKLGSAEKKFFEMYIDSEKFTQFCYNEKEV